MSYNNNKFSYTLLILSVIFLLFVVYKSEVIFSGEKRDYYYTYYILTFIFILVSFISFFLSNKLKIYFKIICITLFFGIYILEISIHIYKQSYNTKIQISAEKEPDQRKINYEKQTGNKYDDRSKYEVYFDAKNLNPNTVVAVHPHYFAKYKELSLYDILPLSGLSYSPTILCNENGYYSTYESDRYGFNNPDEVWDADETEFLIIGGSYTNGSCVNRPHDMASVLRTISNKNVITAGMGGSGPLLQLASLREYFNSSVKNVIWIYYDFNLLDLKNELNYPSAILKNYLINDSYSQNLINKQDFIDKMGIEAIEFGIKKDEEIAINQNIKIEKALSSLKNEKLLAKLLKIIKLYNIRKQLLYTSFQENNYPEEEFKLILSKAKKLIEDNNANFYLVYLPTHQRYLSNLSSVMYDFKYELYPKVKKIALDLDINFIDLHKDFLDKQSSYRDLLPLGIDGHFNIKGYKKITEFIYNDIKSLN